MDHIKICERFERELDSTKFRLAQFNVLSEAIKHSQFKGITGPHGGSVLSSLCTKWMQLNAALERLDEIQLDGTKNDNESQTMTAATANKFMMYSILDEFKLNDSSMPPVMMDGVGGGVHGTHKTGYISHIENETIGLVYIVDVTHTPDPWILFGAKPKRLTRLPKPGEMFGYVFNEKYLVRAMRVEYESGVAVVQKNQYSAWLMDIGCTVVIKNMQSVSGLYEVTEIAKTIPAYAKRFQVVQIPDRTVIYDLLHSRIRYKVIFDDKDLGFVNIENAGVNPFAMDQQKEWNFYLHYLGDHMNGFARQRDSNQMRPIQNATVATKAAAPPKSTTVNMPSPPSIEYLNEFNPFLNDAYEIENIPIDSATLSKNNPFYSDSMENLYETSQVKRKFVNFKLNKMLNIEAPPTNLDRTTEQPKAHQPNANHYTSVEEKILNGNARATDDAIELKTTVLNGSSQQIREGKIYSQLKQVTFNDDRQQSKPYQNGDQQQPSPVSNVHLEINASSTNTQSEHEVTVKEATKSLKSVKLADKQKTCNGDSIDVCSDFPKPKNLPQVGDTIKILCQSIESPDTFYATVVDDPDHDMAVHEFDLMLNEKKHVESFGVSPPKLHEKVLALYGNLYCRAQVISIIDEHSFVVFYVDYGNCAKVKTAQLFKYDSKWDKYPVYALRFRINGIEQVDPWDNSARCALERILIADCDATVNRIQYCERTKRMTYVVDILDENGLNVAETLIQMNFAMLSKDHPNYQSK